MKKEEDLTNQAPTFSISSQLLEYTQSEQSHKLAIKNTGLKTISYETVISDQEHFKLASAYRSFSLAPGITKNITIKHIEGIHCQLQPRQAAQAKIRDSNGKWIAFECRCPSYSVYKEPQLIEYPKQIALGHFDQKVSFDVEFKNICQRNLKIVFEDRAPPKISPSQNNILIATADKKLIIRNLSNDSICLSNETITFQLELTMNDHGQLHEKLNFNIIAEQTSNKVSKSKGKPKIQSQQLKMYSIQLTGFCVSKKLVVKDQNQKIVSQIRNEILTGTSKSSFFFIQTQYHQDVPYTLQAYFQSDSPQKYAEKWRNLSIQFNKDQQANFCSGVLKTQTVNKIQYRINVNYTVDDENYVSKYSKIQFQDDANALRMRNSEYSRKYEDLQVKVVAKVLKDSKFPETCHKIENEWDNNFFIIIPFKCTLINPSLRCQVSSVDQCTNIVILNESKMQVPYSFPHHSLYRIIKSGSQAQSPQSTLLPNKKQLLTINWTKKNERCPVFMEIPEFDLVLYETRDSEMKQNKMIRLPPSRRRPMTSSSSAIKAKEKQLTNKQQLKQQKQLQVSQRYGSSLTRPSSGLHSKSINLLSALKTCRDPNKLVSNKSASNLISKKASGLMKELPHGFSKRPEDYIPRISQLCYILESQNFVKNVHPQKSFIIQVIGQGFVVLNPHEIYFFQKKPLLNGSKDRMAWGVEGQIDVKYRIYGHTPIYYAKSHKPYENTNHFFSTSRQVGTKRNQISGITHSMARTRANQISNLYQPPTYQILSKEIKMSFKQSKQQFEIVEPILIKNLSAEDLEVHCVSIDGQFFKCKEAGSLLIIKPDEIGHFKIGFQPENTVRLSVINRKPPKELRRKAIVKSDNAINIAQNMAIVNKQIKLLVNKNIEAIACVGQIIQKSCSITPQSIKLTNCKYGSAEIIETMVITNTSSHKINFIIEYPPEVSIKPKSGSIQPKCSQNCTITFKPCKKISNLQENIRIFIGGSHLQLVPLLINVEDPEIYIKQTELVPSQNAICGTQVQQLNLEMTIINNNPSQSFIQIDLTDTPLSLGFTKNYHSSNSGLVMENFVRCSQIMETKRTLNNFVATRKKFQNSIHSILSEDNLSQTQTENDNNQTLESDSKPQACSITVAPNNFLIVPMALRVLNPKIGSNLLQIQKNIASLVGFGEIKSPHTIRFNCNKTLLHISPYKQFHEIILTQSQKNYQINLKNTSQNTVRVKTETKQRGKEDSMEPLIICTYKDIQETLEPETSINLSMSFICFEEDKRTMKTTYQLAIYVKECESKNQSDEDQDYCLYFSTTIDVTVPEPFLEISPSVLVMPTVGFNTWSRESFFIKNNGYKEIFVKIIKPTNVAFEFDCQIAKPQPKKSNSKEKSKHIYAASTISIHSEQRKTHKDGQKMLQNQLTKINNTLEVNVSFRSKETISFRCIVEIEDNYNKKYEITVVGTCTESPFFALDAPIGQFVSSASFNSHRSFTSQKSFVSNNSSSHGIGSGIRKNNLQPTDIEDLLFLNSWIGSLIPQISNESTFFYVWLTKVDNFMKFLKQFNVTLNVRGSHQAAKSKGKHDKKQEEKHHHVKLTLAIIFQDLKQQGFQLNSLRIELLEKAEQLEWLNFMWFFLSKTILCPNFLGWLSKNTGCREVQEINYTFVQKNFQQLLTILMGTLLEIKKQCNNNKPIDWKYLIQNFEPLLQNFKHVESRRHLILSLNIIYHKLSNIQHEVIEISDFEFVLNVRNPHGRKVRYFLQCNTKLVVCEQSSNKMMPTETALGYSFIVEENEEISITFSLRNYTLNALSVITKSVLDLLDVVMYNNFIWDPVIVFHIRLKRKDDIVHHVNIECENKSSQEWVYKFESRISAEYRIFFEPPQNNEFIRLLSGQPGFLKKGESTTIRVVYSPENMNKCQATLRIANTMAKQVFLIHGKPLHSSKVQYEKKLKIVQNQQHEQTITIPWQIVIPPKPIPKTASQAQPMTPKITTSSTSRQPNGAIGFLKQAPTGPVYSLKLFNPQNPLVPPTNKYIENLIKKSFNYNPQRKQLTISLTFKYQELLRSLQLLFQVTSTEGTESKLVRLIVDVVPKPLLFHAEIQCEYNRSLTENLSIKNIAKIAETVLIQYGYLPKEAQISKPEAIDPGSNAGLLQNIHKGLFEVVKLKNNDLLSFGTTQKMHEHIDISFKYFPNENNCYFDPQTSQSKPNSQLPFFYIIATYQQSLYRLIYIFKPLIRKSVNKIQSILSQQKRDISHECLPLVKYQNNFIYIENQIDDTITYDVETDLYEISGKNQIAVKPLSVGKYCYEILCLHLGRKQGHITFRQKNNPKSMIQFNISIHSCESATQPTYSPDLMAVNGCVPKGSCMEEGLRIYNQYFEITSTIRKPKIFSIFLANLSQKEIQYEVRCNEEGLHPRIPSTPGKKNTIKISRQSQYELQIMYLPYFTGTRQAKLHLYNPHQPEITYRISMIAEEVVENVVKEMSRIGENKAIQITLQNPAGFLKGNQTNEKEDNRTLELELTSLALNGTIFDSKDYYNHLRLLDDAINEQSLNPDSSQSSKVKVKFSSATRERNIAKFYIMFVSNNLVGQYKYDLIFNTQSYGQYKYSVTYKYPQVERMEPIVVYSEADSLEVGSSSKIKMMAKDKQENKVTLPFVNRFNQDLDLLAKCTDQNGELAVKVLENAESSESEGQLCYQNKSNGQTKIKVGAYRKQEIQMAILNKSGSSRVELELVTIKEPTFKWIYPITIYKVYEYQPKTGKRPPITICGQARIPITAKIYPLISYNCDKIQLVEQNEQFQTSKVEIIMKNDIIRKRAGKVSSRQELLATSQPNVENGIRNQQDNIVSVDRALPDHLHLNNEFVYEIELEIYTACAMRMEGYFYAYQSNVHIESKNISPASSQKYLLRGDCHVSGGRRNETEYFVEKIPFLLKIDPPKTEVLEFEANVGQKSSVKIKIDSLNIKEKEEINPKIPGSNVPKIIDYIMGSTTKDVKIELHNNKCRQFSAQYNEKQQCIEVTYSAQQYSGLKRGRLEISVGGIYSQYELIGKFPKNDPSSLRRNSRFN